MNEMQMTDDGTSTKSLRRKLSDVRTVRDTPLQHLHITIVLCCDSITTVTVMETLETKPPLFPAAVHSSFLPPSFFFFFFAKRPHPAKEMKQRRLKGADLDSVQRSAHDYHRLAPHDSKRKEKIRAD